MIEKSVLESLSSSSVLETWELQMIFQVPSNPNHSMILYLAVFGYSP